MQTVSSGWSHNINKSTRRIGYGVLISWLRTTSSGVKFFTIGQSKIGGPDIIKGGGSAVTFYDKYDYNDYSEYAESLSVSRSLGQFPYGTFMAEATIELDNTSKLFLPNYDSTIGSGILPNRPIKISLGIEDEFMKVFVGFTSMPHNTLGSRQTQLHAFDAFDYINSEKSTTSGVFIDAPLENIIMSGMYEMGFSDSQFELDTSLQQPIGYLSTEGEKWGDIFRRGMEAEQGLMFADETGIVRFWNRQHFTTTSGTKRFELTYSSLEDLQWQNTPIINDVIVTAKPREVQAKQKIWEAQAPIQIPANSSKDYFIEFVDEYGPLPTTSVDIPEYITNADTSYYTTNVQIDGTGENMEDKISITSAYSFGKRYRVTFQNSHSNAIYITQLVVYATPAKVVTEIEERFEDSDSIEAFGRNPSNDGEPLRIDNDLIQDESTAYSLAYTLVKEYKTPGKRYVAPIAVGSDPALQIGDFGTVTILDTGETKNVWIVGKTDTLNRDADYRQELILEERNIKKYFTIGQSRIGGSDGHVIAP